MPGISLTVVLRYTFVALYACMPVQLTDSWENLELFEVLLSYTCNFQKYVCKKRNTCNEESQHNKPECLLFKEECFSNMKEQ